MPTTALKEAMDSAKSAKDSVFSGAEGTVAPVTLLKTAYSKNITIEEWNQIVMDMDVVLREMYSEDALLTATYDMVCELYDDANDYHDLKDNAFSGYMAKNAIADSAGNNIVATYETKADASSKLAKIVDGTTVVGKTRTDENGVNIASGYAALTRNNNYSGYNKYYVKASFYAGIDVTNGITVPHGNYAFVNTKDGALTTYFSLPNDRLSTYFTLATEKYVNAKVTKANLTTVIGLANYVYPGLMSSDDKSRLDALFALLGASEDADAVVNTINEVLAIFAQYPEGVTLANALALKVAFSDVINNLTSNEISKPLSAYQGKVLDGRLAEVEENYVDRDDVFAAGMISVTDYDESTGKITLAYNSSAVAIDYTASTGVIKFTY